MTWPCLSIIITSAETRSPKSKQADHNGIADKKKGFTYIPEKRFDMMLLVVAQLLNNWSKEQGFQSVLLRRSNACQSRVYLWAKWCYLLMNWLRVVVEAGKKSGGISALRLTDEELPRKWRCRYNYFLIAEWIGVRWMICFISTVILALLLR